MRRPVHPRPRFFGSLPTLALLAWTALAFNVFAQPFAVAVGGNTQTAMVMGGAPGTHCDGIMGHVSTGAQSVPAHPVGNGHGCCTNGHCYCASLCNGIVGVPYLGMAWVPPHAPALDPVHAAPARTQVAPPLRPPIA